MAITNYTELKDAIINWSHRDDIDLLIPDFIRLAEKEAYNNPVETLKVKNLEQTTTLTASTVSEFLALPSDYKMLRSSRLDIANQSGFIRYRTPEQLVRYDQTNRPCFFTIVDTRIEFDRVPDEAYEFDINYYAEDSALTEASPTNELLTNHPDIYLWGGVYKAFAWAQETEEMIKYKSMFYEAIAGANKADKEGRFGPAPVMKVDGPTP